MALKDEVAVIHERGFRGVVSSWSLIEAVKEIRLSLFCVLLWLFVTCQ
jgi:hypothetical protein